MTRRATRSLVLLCALLALLAASGCGGGDGGGDDGAAPEERAPAEEVTDEEIAAAVAEAAVPEDYTNEVEVAAAAPEDAGPITATAEADFDYAEYEASVADLAAYLDEFWEAEFQEAYGESYGSPADIYGYYPEEDYEDVLCGGEPAATPENAFYCGETDEIAWDEPGLFIPYYLEKGDLAVGIVLAHEWGHLIQNRNELEFPLTYEQELHADCLAGAWLGAMDEEGLLDGAAPGEGGDIDEALDAIYSIGDPPDTPFEDPTAHGQPDERVEAVDYGYSNSVEGCDEDYAPGWTEEEGVEVPEESASAAGDSLGDE